MKFIVINDHVCMVALEKKTIDGKDVWVPKRVTLCELGLTAYGISILSEELPEEYLCSPCDAVSNRRPTPSCARQLPKLTSPKVRRYEHLPGKAGICLVSR